jgi:hypothetical protein
VKLTRTVCDICGAEITSGGSVLIVRAGSRGVRSKGYFLARAFGPRPIRTQENRTGSWTAKSVPVWEIPSYGRRRRTPLRPGHPLVSPHQENPSCEA